MAELARGRTALHVSSAGREALTRILAPHRPALALLLLAGLLYLTAVWNRDVWNPDEPRYAEVAREMREDGHWLVPHVNGRLYSEKPPLQFWAIAVASLVTGGVDEVSARLPAVLAAVATLLLLFGLAERLFDRRVAWWSALVFLTASKILWQGRIGQIDMLLIALVTAAMYCFVRGLVEERPGFHRLFFVFTGATYTAWISELVPERIRGRFFGRRNATGGILAMVVEP